MPTVTGAVSEIDSVLLPEAASAATASVPRYNQKLWIGSVKKAAYPSA